MSNPAKNKVQHRKNKNKCWMQNKKAGEKIPKIKGKEPQIKENLSRYLYIFEF